jgi:hypothetical protein
LNESRKCRPHMQLLLQAVSVGLHNWCRRHHQPALDVPLKRQDFRDITYWDKPDWLAAKSRQGSILGPGTKVKKSTVLYIQHTNGSYATPHELEELCSFARSIWSQFILIGVAPTTWT